MGRNDGKSATPRIDLGYPRDLKTRYDFPRGERLGKGGFGVVHLVKARSSGDSYACKEICKFLDASLTSTEKQRRHIENIQREVAVLKKLKGSLNVVNLEAVYEDDASVYIITECCFGGELLHTIGIRPYSEQTVARIMKAVLRTLAQCHERGILHRDVKPGNFMFLRKDAHSPIKAIDFGLAVFFDEQDLPRKDLGFDGTPWFMAPEVLSSQVVPASDVWSAGVMTYQLLSGYLPFDDKKSRSAPALSAVWASVLNDEPEFTRRCWNEVSPEAKDFIQQLLQKDPTKRPTAVEALGHPWIEKQSTGDGTDVTHLPHTIVQRIQRFGQSSLFKRTVLDMIANELLESYVEKTRYNEQQFLKRCVSQGGPQNTGHPLGGRSERAQTQAIEVLKGLQSRRQWGSMADLAAGSPMSLDDWQIVRRASRLALDTSHHGSETYSAMDLPSPSSSPQMDFTPAESILQEGSLSPPAKPVSLQAVLEDRETVPDVTSRNEEGLRGRSLYKDYVEAQGRSLSEYQSTAEPVAALDPRAQRIEHFLKSMFGIEDSNETRKVVEFLNFGLSSNISEKELMTGLEKLGYEVDLHEMSFLIDIMAPGRDSVNFTQFVASQIDWESLQHTHKEAWMDCVRHAFESMDRDRDGALSTADILSAIAEKLPNKVDIDAAMEQARAEACAAELNMSFEDFLALLQDDPTSWPLKSFDSRYNSQPTTSESHL